MQNFNPTRTAALERLRDFLPHAGRDYAAKRNLDIAGHPHVSGLSPYIRHRAIKESDVLEAVLDRFSPSSAEKFIQEVYWRTYWKGWLELRPEVWDRYQTQLSAAAETADHDVRLKKDLEAAIGGQTGIDCFDHWAQELVQRGYLHNHARMWFASIWIFTLRLPWVLGADFFLRHLLDGDPASNTLGWRWVAGLQTRGKTYLARPDNIARYTEGRFQPVGLAQIAPPLEDAPFGPPGPMPMTSPAPGTAKTGFLLHWEDLSPTELIRRPNTAAAILRPSEDASSKVAAFRKALTEDAAARYGLGDAPWLAPNEVGAWAAKAGVDAIVTPYAPVGPVATSLTEAEAACQKVNVTLHRQLRDYDAQCWPHATKGFFKFKEKIPTFLKSLQSRRAA